uniref:Type II/III secretion system secretin-like domain-containing protein n=1 Tax=Pseudothermotoga hypogea TaxID=57487 RepID=A0A832I9P3_9THEM
MRRLVLLLMLILAMITFATSLVRISPTFSVAGVTLVMEFDSDVSERNVYLERNASGSLVSIYLQDVRHPLDSFFLPIAYGPVESLRVINTHQGSLVLVQLLVPKEPEMSLSRRTLKLFVPSSQKQLSLALVDGDVETAVKYLCEELKLNVVVSEKVKSQKLSLKLDDVLPEDALRNVLVMVRVGNEPLAYSYMPDGTLHIGTRSEIAARFQKFWGIFEVKDESLVQKLESLLSPNVVMSYLANKSVLFVYGDVQEQEMIAKILSLTPQIETREFFSEGFVDEAKKLLDALKGLYNFEYHLLEALNKFILKADPQTLDKVFQYLRELEKIIRLKQSRQEVEETQEPEMVQQTVSETLQLIYAKEAIEVLKKFQLEAEEISFGLVRIAGDPKRLELARKVLEDLGFLDSQQVRKLVIPKVHSEKILNALTEILSIPKSRILVSEDKDVVNVALIAPRNVQDVAEELCQRLIRVFTAARFSEIFFLKDRETAQQVSAILNQIYGIDASSVENVLRVVGTNEEIDRARKFINVYVRERHTKALALTIDQELFAELKTLIESLFDVRLEANLRSLGLLLLSSEDKQQLESAAQEIESVVKLLSERPSKTHELVPVIETVDFNDLRLLLSEIYGVRVEKTQFFYLLVGQREALESAKQLLDRIRDLVGKPVETTYRLVKVREDLSVDALIRAVISVAKVEIVSIGNLLLIKGEETQIFKALELVALIEENVPVKVEEPKKITVIVKELVPEFPAGEFKAYLAKIGLEVDFEAFAALNIVVVSGEERAVAKAAAEYEKFAETILKKIQARAEEEKERREKLLKVQRVSEDVVSVECDGIALKDVIETVAKELGVSIVFVTFPQETITMKVSTISWQQFKDVIEKNYGYSFVETEGVTVVLKPAPVLDTTAEQKFIYKVSHNLDKIKSVVEFYGGRVYVDDLNDLLILTNLSVEAKQEVERLIDELSKPLKQVEIEARFIDRSLTDELTRRANLALEMPSASAGIGSSGTLNLSMSVIDLVDYRNLLSLLAGAQVTLDVSAQNSNSLTDLLASPRIVTVSGKEAKILIGERVPFVAGVDEAGRILIDYMDVGIQLRITPIVRSDGSIQLKLYTEVSEVKERTLSGMNTYGKITRQAETEVILKSDQTLVIGGLVQDKSVKSVAKVPVLGELPFIGQLFRSVTDRKDKAELLIFITARVIEP